MATDTDTSSMSSCSSFKISSFSSYSILPSPSDEPPKPSPETTCRLLNLPAELRNLIYHYALIDPPFWAKRHSPFCEYSAKTVDDIPIPPVALVMLPTKHPLPQCPCTRRKGIKFLQTCRQIHREASPIFWSNNIFLFNKRVDFITCVGGTMSPSDRNWLTHVVVVEPDRHHRYQLHTRPDRDGLANGTSSRHLWEVLLKCKNLRRVDLEPDYLDYQGRQIRRAARTLPKLRSLRAAKLHYRSYMAPPEDVPGVPKGWRAPPCVPVMVFYSTISLQYEDLAYMRDFEAEEAAHSLAMDCVFIFGARLNTSIVRRFGIPRATARSIDATYDGLGSTYPYDEVEQYVENPTAFVIYDEAGVEIHMMGLPESPYQLWADLGAIAVNRRLSTTGMGHPDALVQECYWTRIKWRRRLFRRLRGVLAVLGYQGLRALVSGLRRYRGQGDGRLIILAEAALSIAASCVESIHAMGDPEDTRGMPDESACIRAMDKALMMATCYILRRIFRCDGVEDLYL